MAKHTITTDTRVASTTRRSMLGMIAGVPVAATFAAIPVEAMAAPGGWSVAKRAYRAARDAENHYDKTVAWPAWEAEKESGAVFDERITDESDRLCTLRCKAEETLMHTPSPDLNAAIWKVEHTRERWEENDESPDDWWDAVMADLRRLAAH